MARNDNDNDAQEGHDRPMQFVLYIAGNTISSCKARANLDALVEATDKPCAVTVVDVLRSPQLALQEGIFATPSLTVAGGPSSRLLIIGDLSDRDSVLSALGGAA